MGHAILLGGENLRVCTSSDFDGTNDNFARGADLTGSADSKTGLFSAWLRIDAGNGAVRYIWSSPNAGATASSVFISINAINTLTVVLRNAAGSTLVTATSSSTNLASSTWLHLLASWDAAANVIRMYVSDVSKHAGPITNDNIDYTCPNHYVGASFDGSSNRWNGCLAEVYFAIGQYLDISVEANRRKFISTGGRPVFLGTDGSLPTGTSPLVYLPTLTSFGNAAAVTNAGTGGNFSAVADAGGIGLGSTSPST